MGNLNFNSAEIDPINMDYEPLPDGRYQARVNDSELKANSTNTGELLRLTFEILQEPYLGRLVFCQLNTTHDSEKAQKIGRGMLSSLCRAVGKVGLVSDSTELHDRPLFIKLIVVPASPPYAAKNEVKGFYPLEKKTAATTKKTKKSEPEPIEAKDEDDDLPEFLKG